MLKAAYCCIRVSSLSLQPNSDLNLYDVAGNAEVGYRPTITAVSLLL